MAGTVKKWPDVESNPAVTPVLTACYDPRHLRKGLSACPGRVKLKCPKKRETRRIVDRRS
jgi:hypothetical protein